MTKKYSDFIEILKAAPPLIPMGYKSTLREDYVDAKIFNIGDFVLTKDGDTAEIIDRGPNYLTLVKEGATFKSWLKDVSPVQVSTQKRRSQLYKESFIIKGYKTKNFTRELSEQFKSISEIVQDTHALYNSVICLDALLGIDPENITEQYHQYKSMFDRACKYFKKFDVVVEELDEIEDMLLTFSIQEDVKFNANDKMKIATLISTTCGSTSSGSPSSIVNASTKKFKQSSHSKDAWKMFGKLLNKATQAGILWDKDIFTEASIKFMEIE